MIVLRNNIYERSFSVIPIGGGRSISLDWATMKKLAQEQGLSLREFWAKLKSNPEYAGKFSTKENIVATKPAVINVANSSNPKVQEMSARQVQHLQARQTRTAAKPNLARDRQLAQIRQHDIKTQTASGVSSNPKVQEMRARQAQAQKDFEAAKPKPTQEQLAQARRGAAKAQRVSLQDVGTAGYIQPTQVNAPNVYRNDAFTKPGNIERLKGIESIVLGRR